MKDNFELFVHKEKKRDKHLKEEKMFEEEDLKFLDMDDDDFDELEKEGYKLPGEEEEDKDPENQKMSKKKGIVGTRRISQQSNKLKSKNSLDVQRKNSQISNKNFKLKKSKTNKLVNLEDQKEEDKMIKQRMKQQKIVQKKGCCEKFGDCCSSCGSGIKSCGYGTIKCIMEGYEFLTEGLFSMLMKKFRGCFTSMGFVDGKPPL